MEKCQAYLKNQRPSRNAHQQPPGSSYLDTFHVWNLIINKARSWWWSIFYGWGKQVQTWQNKKNCWVRPPKMSEHVWFEDSNKLKLHLLRNLYVGFPKRSRKQFRTTGLIPVGLRRTKILFGWFQKCWAMTNHNQPWMNMNEWDAMPGDLSGEATSCCCKIAQSQGG